MNPSNSDGLDCTATSGKGHRARILLLECGGVSHERSRCELSRARLARNYMDVSP